MLRRHLDPQEGASRLAERSVVERLQGNVPAENDQQVFLRNTIVISFFPRICSFSLPLISCISLQKEISNT